MADQQLRQRTDDGAYLPTVAEIESAAAEIRATWSENDYRKRLGLRAEHYVEVRCCRFDGQWNGLFSRVLEAFELSGGEVV